MLGIEAEVDLFQFFLQNLVDISFIKSDWQISLKRGEKRENLFLNFLSFDLILFHK